MPRILAIEADPKRQRALSAFVHERVKATLVVVASVRAAIAAIEECTPDLITVPTLLSPSDEMELLAHMKSLDSAPYVQMLTVPALDMLGDAEAEAPRRGILGIVFDRRPVSLGLQYEPRLVAAQMEDGLARARELRLEYAAMLAFQDAMGGRSLGETSLVLTASGTRQLVMASGVEHSLERARDERRVALRKGPADLPWLSNVTLWSGQELKLINISSTGVLVETGSKLDPGTTANIQLCGPELNLVVPVRFIRSDVARVDGRGVRYRAAGAFARTLDLDGHGVVRAREAFAPTLPPPAPPTDLAALFGAVLSSTRNEPAHAQFLHGLRQLVGARDVRVSSGPAEPAAGPETFFFEIPGSDRACTALRVTFDRTHEVTEAQFRLLKAAACLMAAVLELEKPASLPAAQVGPRALIAGRVA